MAIDSQQKRASAMMVGLPFRPALIVPDGSIDEEDRAAVVYLYSGIDYDGDAPPGPSAINDWLITARRRGSR